MAGSILLTSTEITGWVNSLFWPFTRIAAMIVIAPIFGGQMIPVRIRLLFALLLTVVIVPLLPAAPAINPLSVEGVFITLQQMLIGLMLGFSVQLVFAALVLAGQVTAMGMGLGFASMVDPQNGVQVPVVGQYYAVVATLLFLAMNGHLMLIQTLADSFQYFQIGTGILTRESLQTIALWGSRMFADALMVALPVVTAILLANISFGVVSRAAPQLNVFGVGFPAVMTLGFVALIFAIGNLLPQLESMLDSALLAASQLGQAGR